MSPHLPICDVCYWLYFGIEIELQWNLFTLLFVCELIIVKGFVIIDLLFFEEAGLEDFGHDLLGFSDAGLVNLFEGCFISLDLFFKIVDEFFELVDGPIIEIDVFGLIFDGAHEVHETFGIEPSFEDFVSEENLFFVL